MSEITKLYENAGVKKEIPKICSSNELYCKECEAHIEDAMPYCKNAEYPPFTAEKQLDIVKFLLDKSIYYNAYGNRKHWFYLSDEIENSKYREFDETIAGLINSIWQDLTEEEKQQVKGILE